jgi:predicted MFS family arabinose efflux permease
LFFSEAGFPDDFRTYGLVSSLYTATFSLGNAVGPVVSGVLYDAVGFRWGTMFIIVLGLLVVKINIIFI